MWSDNIVNTPFFINTELNLVDIMDKINVYCNKIKHEEIPNNSILLCTNHGIKCIIYALYEIYNNLKILTIQEIHTLSESRTDYYEDINGLHFLCYM